MGEQDDLILPPLVEKRHAGPFLWIAHAGHYEFCHVDPDDGLLMIISGSKVCGKFLCLKHLVLIQTLQPGFFLAGAAVFSSAVPQALPEPVGLARSHHSGAGFLYVYIFSWTRKDGYEYL